MKAQKILGIAACAAACAASSAFAKDETWFDGKVDTTTKDAISTPTAATWTKPAVDVQLNAGSISLFNDANDPLVLTPDSVVSKKTDGLVTISGKAVLAPNDELATSGAQAGIAVKTVDGVNTYFGYDGSAWHQLVGVAAPADDAVTEFKILLDYRTKKAKFYVGGTLLNEDGTTEFPIAKESVEKISAFGFGTLSKLAAEYEVAVAAVVDGETETRYGSIAEAVEAAADGDGKVQPDKIAVVDEETGDTGKPDAVADNGLKQWENVALGIDDKESIPLVPAKGIDDKDNIYLALAPDNQLAPDTGVKVTFAVSKDGGVPDGPYPSTAIRIEKAAGEHTYQVVPTITVTVNAGGSTEGGGEAGGGEEGAPDGNPYVNP